MNDSYISILQYIKSNNVSIENEIRNLQAGGDINIIINDFIINSPDYKFLQEKIIETSLQLQAEIEPGRRQILDKKLENLYKIEKDFKVDILRLAHIFSHMEIRTERIRNACQFFEEGKFKEADSMLNEEELANDQFNLIVYVDYLEFRLNNIMLSIEVVLNERYGN